MIPFKYFAEPERLTELFEDETTCDLCKETKECFPAEAQDGEGSIEAICPECLASGKLMERDITTVEGDYEELIKQLTHLHPDLSKEEIEKLADEKTNELEKTTPPLVTYEDWVWPCIEGDYCRFIGYGSQAFYDVYANGEGGKELFIDSLYNKGLSNSEAAYLWDDVLSEEEIVDYEDSTADEMVFYVFKSLHSDTLITVIDSEDEEDE